MTDRMIPRYAIIGTRPDGSEFEAFRWCRDAASGIVRAENDGAQCGVEATYRAAPLTIVWTAMEFWGHGDPAMGGTADDRVLRVDGQFGRTGHGRPHEAEYPTAEAARAAAEAAPNRRPDGLLSITYKARLAS